MVCLSFPLPSSFFLASANDYTHRCCLRSINNVFNMLISDLLFLSPPFPDQACRKPTFLPVPPITLPLVLHDRNSKLAIVVIGIKSTIGDRISQPSPEYEVLPLQLSPVVVRLRFMRVRNHPFLRLLWLRNNSESNGLAL